MNRAMKWCLAFAALAALCAVPSPALAYGFTPYGVCLALAALAAYALLTGLRRREARALCPDGAASIGFIGRADALELMLCAAPAALLCARLSYCLIRFSFYFMEMGPVSVLRYWEGGGLLWGAAAGALGAAALLARRRGASVAMTLDELAAPGLLAIAIARLGEWPTGEGVGAWIENEALMRLPFAVMNAYEEWQLAVFLFEAAAALLLLIPVLKKRAGSGERILTALLLFASCQVMLESLRMDSCLKIGFVRVAQVASAVVILAVTAIRAARRGKKALVRRCALVLLGTALVGGMEWALEKTPVDNVLIYALMFTVCAGFAVNGERFAEEK